jgi:hypothetical protein
MADIDDSVAAVCPIMKLVQAEPKNTLTIYRVTWLVHNKNQAGYYTTRMERLFESKEAADRFNETRKSAAQLVGLLEHPSAGAPTNVEVERD